MRMPGTIWSPSPNCDLDSVSRPPRGMVLHTADGSYQGTIDWQMEPVSQVSSYFVTSFLGDITQVVDTDNKAWTQSDGNADWIGVENEGHGEMGMALTDLQLDAVAHIYAWLHLVYGIPFQTTDDPNGFGLGWHGMGGQAWGGHLGCPGDAIKAQRPEILRRAQAFIQPPIDWKKIEELVHWLDRVSHRRLALGDRGPDVATLNELLTLHGYKKVQGDAYGLRTEWAVLAFKLNPANHLTDRDGKACGRACALALLRG